MTDLEWTDEPPEEPGWYWLDYLDEVEMVKVRFHPSVRNLLFGADRLNDTEMLFWEGNTAEFRLKGPIPEPE